MIEFTRRVTISSEGECANDAWLSIDELKFTSNRIQFLALKRARNQACDTLASALAALERRGAGAADIDHCEERCLKDDEDDAEDEKQKWQRIAQRKTPPNGG